MPFLGHDEQVRGRIKSLNLTCIGGVGSGPMPAAALALLFRSLPALQHVTLWDGAPAHSILEQRLLYDGLSASQRLESLSLPSGRAVHSVHLLGGSLRQLSIRYHPDGRLDVPMAQSVARLTRLQHLTLDLALEEDPEPLRLLLSCVPPSFRVLQLTKCCLISTNWLPNATLRFEERRVVSFDISSAVDLSGLAGFVHGVVLPSGAAGAQLHHVVLAELHVAAEDAADLGGPACSALWALRRRCGRFEVGVLRFKEDVAPRRARACVSLLGESVAELRLAFDHWFDLSVRLRPAAAALGARGVIGEAAPENAPVAAAASTVSPAAACTDDPQPPCLCDVALERMLAEGARARAHAAAAADAGPSSSAGADDGMHGPGRGRQLLLLMRGPLLDIPPWRTKEWVRKLAEYARGAAALVPGTSLQGRPSPLGAFLPLPIDSGALLAVCPTEADVAVVEAAARAVAAAAAADSSPTETPAGGGGVPLLDVLPAAVEVPPGNQPVDWQCARDYFLHTLNKVVRRVFDGELLSAAWSRQQRLDWLLGEWESVRDLDKLHVL